METPSQSEKEADLCFRFGNGQFACLLLCLTLTDLASSSLGLVGGLVLELRDLAWAGNSLGCAAYYFTTSWLLVKYTADCLLINPIHLHYGDHLDKILTLEKIFNSKFVC